MSVTAIPPTAPGTSTAPAEENAPPPRTTSPPLWKSWQVRGVSIPNFAEFTPKNIRVTNSGTLTHVAWSCDGRRIATCGPEKWARLWTPEKSFEIRNTLPLSSGHSDYVDNCAWSPVNPDHLCTASSRDMRLVFWDAKSKTPLQQSMSLKPKQPSKLIYSPDGKTLLVLTRQGNLIIMRSSKRSDGKEEWSITPDKLKVNESEVDVVSCAWSNNGTEIIIGDERGLLTYYTYPGLRRGPATGAHSGGATSIAFDPRGRYIATVGADSIVNLFDIESWRVASTLDCTEDQVNDIAFSSDGEYIAVAFARSLEIWATETGELLHKVTQPVTPCRSVAWHPWKNILAFGGQSHQENSPRAAPQSATLSFFGL